MKKSVALGVPLAALLLAACSEATEDETPSGGTTVSAQPTVNEESSATEEPTDTASPTADLTGEPTDDPSNEPSDGPSAPAEQTATAMHFETDLADVPLQDDIPVAITWETPGETFHIYTMGSSTDGCYVVPTEAWTDSRSIDVNFQPADSSLMCTDDLVLHSWERTGRKHVKSPKRCRCKLFNVLGHGPHAGIILNPDVQESPAQLPPRATMPLAYAPSPCLSITCQSAGFADGH